MHSAVPQKTSTLTETIVLAFASTRPISQEPMSISKLGGSEKDCRAGTRTGIGATTGCDGGSWHAAWIPPAGISSGTSHAALSIVALVIRQVLAPCSTEHSQVPLKVQASHALLSHVQVSGLQVWPAAQGVVASHAQTHAQRSLQTSFSPHPAGAPGV